MSVKVYEFLKSELADLIDHDIDAISMETQLETLNLDSLDTVQIQIALKRRFGVDIFEDLPVDVRDVTVGKLCSMVASIHAAKVPLSLQPALATLD